MNLAERRLIQRALGPAIIAAMDRVTLQPEPGAWRALARAVILSAGDVASDPRGRAILAAICRRAVVADDRVPGRIGEHQCNPPQWIQSPQASFFRLSPRGREGSARNRPARM